MDRQNDKPEILARDFLQVSHELAHMFVSRLGAEAAKLRTLAGLDALGAQAEASAKFMVQIADTFEHGLARSENASRANRPKRRAE